MRLINSDYEMGKSTAQLREAPLGTIYVCPDLHFLSVMRNMARKWERYDIQFIPVEHIGEKSFSGLRQKPIIIDHAVELNKNRWEILKMFLGSGNIVLKSPF